MANKILLGIAMVLVVGVVAGGLWFLFFHQSGTSISLGNNTTITTQNSQSFSTSNTSGGTGGSAQTETVVGGVSIQTPQQKIFKLADGPVEDATFVETQNPTSTLARYVMQDSGHILDIPVDVPGAVARVMSNITIPGLGSAMWFPQGNAALVQYAENGVIKTVYVGLPTGNTSTSSVRVRFLPDGITSVGASPDGNSVVYLLPTLGGVNGYIAKADGSSPVKLFSSALSQALLSWPATSTLLFQTKEAEGVPGIAFAVSALTGVMTPLVYAPSLSTIANPSFSKMVYQTTQADTVRTTYSHDVATGRDLQLPFNPLPEKCTWSTLSSVVMFCAAPINSTPVDYLDLWHQGLYNIADSIFAFNINAGITRLVALPGSAQGGTQANIASVRVSPDGQYLLYITRGDRSLWGVRLNL